MKDDIIHILTRKLDGLARTECGIYVNWTYATDVVSDSDCIYCLNHSVHPYLLGEINGF